MEQICLLHRKPPSAGASLIAAMLNPLNSELNPICHLLALLGAHPIFHVSRIRVKGHCKRTIGYFMLNLDIFPSLINFLLGKSSDCQLIVRLVT
jgi:hypothetical protein